MDAAETPDFYTDMHMSTLETGKLKSEFLEKILGKIEIRDKKVVVGPGIGEDAAAIDIGESYLIVKSDPITFVSDRIGWYVVNINANDIAAMGGSPRWFLVTMLLPERSATVRMLEDIMKDLRQACRELDIELIGGHTEVTHGLHSPILSGTMLGEAAKGELISNVNICEGDLLYMTKGVAIEATSIIAREKKEEVIGTFGKDFYTSCLEFLSVPGISVVSDAFRARNAARVTGMHDPTEGGVISGAYEMARASGRGLEIFLERIPVYTETADLCRHFHLSPFNLIASGALLISVPKEEAHRLEQAFERLHESVPPISCIGEFTASGERFWLVEDGKRKAVRPTGIDDVTKLFV
jgi:hydrogenase expression/formation protein HypE